MKHWKWIASTGLVAVLAIAYVTADSPQELQRTERKAGGGDRLGPIFQLFDGDGNGEVTRTELAQSDAAFDKLDRNQDGVLSRADFPERTRGRRASGMLATRIAEAADADGSGDVTAAEWQGVVAAIETDADGAIVPESLHEVLGLERAVGSGHGPRREGSAPTAADLNNLFSKLDRDGNGLLEEGELMVRREGAEGRDGRKGRGGPGAMHGPGSRNPMSKADADQSGEVTADEWQTLFVQLDRNADGTLTPEELQPGRADRGPRREARGSRQN